jgi:hypothetical protein
MILIRYHGEVAGFIGATSYALTPELAALPSGHPDRRRLDAICRVALEYRAMTGRELGAPVRPRRKRKHRRG